MNTVRTIWRWIYSVWLRIWRWIWAVKPQAWIAFLCFIIVFARFRWPDLRFDSLSLYLILVAMLCILIPDLAQMIARIKKIKIGDKEIELSEALDRIARQTERIENRVSDAAGESFERSEEPPIHIEKYLKDPRGGLIAIAADIEIRVQHLLSKEDLSSARRYTTPLHGVELLAKYGHVVPDLPILMRDFWTVRNRVVHGSEARMTEQDIYRLVDLGVRILELLSIRKKG